MIWSAFFPPSIWIAVQAASIDDERGDGAHVWGSSISTLPLVAGGSTPSRSGRYSASASVSSVICQTQETKEGNGWYTAEHHRCSAWARYPVSDVHLRALRLFLVASNVPVTPSARLHTTRGDGRASSVCWFLFNLWWRDGQPAFISSGVAIGSAVKECIYSTWTITPHLWQSAGRSVIWCVVLLRFCGAILFMYVEGCCGDHVVMLNACTNETMSLLSFIDRVAFFLLNGLRATLSLFAYRVSGCANSESSKRKDFWTQIKIYSKEGCNDKTRTSSLSYTATLLMLNRSLSFSCNQRRHKDSQCLPPATRSTNALLPFSEHPSAVCPSNHTAVCPSGWGLFGGYFWGLVGIQCNGIGVGSVAAVIRWCEKQQV